MALQCITFLKGVNDLLNYKSYLQSTTLTKSGARQIPQLKIISYQRSHHTYNEANTY